MTDLSKIDFSRLTLPDWCSHAVKASIGPLGVELRRGKHYRFAYLRLGGSAWEYVGPSRWNDLEVAKTYTDRVDAFIVEELARLAAEDEAANWVAVPWQDVEWLYEQRAVIKRRFSDRDAFEPLCDLEDLSGFHWFRFTADRRTLPAGYDPLAPRWVEVEDDDFERLVLLGVNWKREPSGDYIDIHTLKTGVPLRVETPKLNLSAGMTSCATCGVTDCQAPSSPVDCGRYVREKKPSPRPCTREFALAHPGESEWRKIGVTNWRPMACPPTGYVHGNEDRYEFRTTANEPERRQVTVEFDGKRWAGELVEQ